MKKDKKPNHKVLKIFAGICFIFFGLPFIFASILSQDKRAWIYILIWLPLVAGGIALIIIGKRNSQQQQPPSSLQRLVNDEKTEQTSDVYILDQEGHVTGRADGRPISDNEQIDLLKDEIRERVEDIAQHPFQIEINHSEHIVEPPPDASEQAKATYRIVRETNLNNAKSIEEKEAIWRERSDRLYEERQQRVNSFNPFSIERINNSDVPLTAAEMSFLQYMNGITIKSPYIPAYWVYEYNIEYPVVMTKLLQCDYLKISTPRESVPFLKIPELKDLLRKKELKLSGKKNELIDRVLAAYSDEELNDTISDDIKKYILTEKGKRTVEDLSPSATKDADFEDRCMKSIIVGDVDGAYKMICKRELEKMLPRGLGVDWKQHLNNGLSDFTIKNYTDFLSSNICNEIPSECKMYDLEYKASIILCIMLGKTSRDSVKVFKRVTNVEPESIVALTKCMQQHMFEILDKEQVHCFEELRD